MTKLIKATPRIFAALVVCILCQSALAQETAQETGFNVMVQKAGEGNGMVISSPPGIECGNDATNCSATFNSGTPVTLTPKEGSAGSIFEGWSGTSGSNTHCETTKGPCSFIINADSSATATFVVASQ